MRRHSRGWGGWMGEEMGVHTDTRSGLRLEGQLNQAGRERGIRAMSAPFFYYLFLNIYPTQL